MDCSIYNLPRIACNTLSSAEYLAMDLTFVRNPTEFSTAIHDPKFRHGLNTPVGLEPLGERMINTEEYRGQFAAVCRGKKPINDEAHLPLTTRKL